MRNLCLSVSRFCIAAWVGAAALFVVTSIGEQGSQKLDSMARNALAAIRFPSYYAFGFTLVILALVAAVIGRGHFSIGKRRMWVYLALLTVALVLMTIDYLVIYQPLLKMMDLTVRPAKFVSYHVASKYINLVDVSLCFAACVVIGWTSRRH